MFIEIYAVLSLAKVVALYTALVCKFVRPKIRSCKFLTNFKSAPKVIYGSGFEVHNYFESAPLPGLQSTILFCEGFLCFHMARR